MVLHQKDSYSLPASSVAAVHTSAATPASNNILRLTRIPLPRLLPGFGLGPWGLDPEAGFKVRGSLSCGSFRGIQGASTLNS